MKTCDFPPIRYADSIVNRLRKNRRLSGLSAIETCAIFAVVGTALAIFVPTFFRGLETDRMAEAPRVLALLEKGISKYYVKSHNGDRHCLPEQVGPTRAVVDGDPAILAADELELWSAFGLDENERVRFQYEIKSEHSGCDVDVGTRIDLRAFADFDRDGSSSEFRRILRVGPEGLQSDGILYVRDRVE